MDNALATARRIAFSLLTAATCFGADATELKKTERQVLLDTARPIASTKAGQPVRIKVDKLNVDNGWAVLVGSIVSTTGKGIDWRLASECHLDLDKMLWVVLHKSKTTWQVEHIAICAPEPPYWYLEQYGGFAWPCGVYAGLEDGGEETLEKRCRRERTHRH